MDNAFDMAAIGKRISNHRRSLDMTQMELADKLSISYQAVSNWERGLTMPDIGKLPDLAQIFNTSVDELLQGGRIAEIVQSVAQGEPPSRITADELVEVAPILKAEQVDELAQHVTNGFNQGQSERIIPLMSFEGDYEYSNEELAERFFDGDKIPFFAVVAPMLSDDMRAAFAERAYTEDKKIPFFAMLMHYMSPQQRNAYRRRAMDDDKIAYFSVLSHASH